MAHWNRPPDLSELEELVAERPRRAATRGRWYLSAFAAGLALIFALGVGSDLFDRGPTDLDVSAAYRVGFDQGSEDAESYWIEALEEAWWEGYYEGNADGSSVSPNLSAGVRDGFDWDGGYEAGMQSDEVNVAEQYWEGWMEGFNRGWSSVSGESTGASATNETNGGGEP